ncbi:DUF3261 domain-containing protein [Thermodesulfobacteriota bacterium]
MKTIFLSLSLTIFCAGCAAVLFEPVPLVPLGETSPAQIREHAERSLPERFATLSSIVFKYRMHSTTALGYTEVNCPEDSFSVVALSPTGIKLFELSAKGDQIETHYVMEELLEHGDLPATVAGDIRKIFFHRNPSPSAVSRKDVSTVTFRENREDGCLTEYILGGSNPALIKKRLYENNDLVWTVTYHEYRDHNGRLYPAGIVLKHHQYKYQLIIRLKEIYD